MFWAKQYKQISSHKLLLPHNFLDQSYLMKVEILCSVSIHYIMIYLLEDLMSLVSEQKWVW